MNDGPWRFSEIDRQYFYKHQIAIHSILRLRTQSCTAMMLFDFVLVIPLSTVFWTGIVVDAFTTSSTSSSSTTIFRWSSTSSKTTISHSKTDDAVESSRHSSATRVQMLVRQRSDTEGSYQKKREDCNLPCASLYDTNDDDDNDDESRREALFSMVGTLWAITGTSIPIIGLAAASIQPPLPANAASGDFAKIELPNPYQTLADRATKQCLSESLGNRECLVYADDADKFLYKGFDGSLLLQRLKTSTEALSKIPNLIEDKKWSQVTGVLLGPMGELLVTMNQMVAMASKSEGSDDALVATLRAKLNVVKKDLYAMQAAVDKRQADVALKYHAQSTIHLDEFIQAAL
jgi:hypothetical protein